jgi:hypothetical protein
MVGTQPSVGVESRASVGSPVLAQFDYLAAVRGVVQQPYARSVGFNVLRVEGGELLIRSTLGASRGAWCTSRPAFFAAGEARGVCFLDVPGTAPQMGDIAVLREAYIANTAVGTEVAVEVAMRLEAVCVGTGFRHEFLFQGRDRSGVRLSYREYVNDMARPVFSQDLVYDIAPGQSTVVNFRQARIEILSADNQEIRYRVVSSFR